MFGSLDISVSLWNAKYESDATLGIVTGFEGGAGLLVLCWKSGCILAAGLLFFGLADPGSLRKNERINTINQFRFGRKYGSRREIK